MEPNVHGTEDCYKSIPDERVSNDVIIVGGDHYGPVTYLAQLDLSSRIKLSGAINLLLGDKTKEYLLDTCRPTVISDIHYSTVTDSSVPGKPRDPYWLCERSGRRRRW